MWAQALRVVPAAAGVYQPGCFSSFQAEIKCTEQPSCWGDCTDVSADFAQAAILAIGRCLLLFLRESLHQTARELGNHSEQKGMSLASRESI